MFLAVALILFCKTVFSNRAAEFGYQATECSTAIKQSIPVLCIIDPVLVGQKIYLKITLPKVTCEHITVCVGTM